MDELNAYVENALEEFKCVTKQPELFLSVDDENVEKIKTRLKASYDHSKNAELKTIKSQALPELIVKNFDLEQIWQQIELQNDGYLMRSLANVSKLVVAKDKLVFEELKDEAAPDDGIEDAVMEEEELSGESSSESEDDKEEINFSDGDELSLKSSDLEEDETNEEVNVKQTKKNSVKKSVVDDDFFKLDEMEAFLQAEERKENDKEPDSGNDSENEELEEEEEEEDSTSDVDLFNPGALESNDTERGQKNNPKYKDFFGDPEEGESKRDRNKFMEEVDEMEDEEEREKEVGENQKSSLELREERLKRKIEEIEEGAVGEKPWQLKGEITAEGRPVNSLLEEIVEFDLTSRPAPVITEETTMVLEDIIRQRIKDKVFDSVERKERPEDTPLEYKKKLVLDQEKSKESLAQIYEKEYLAQKEALDPESQDKEEEEPELHKEIKKLMSGLFSKLDSLSNFHFTPKQAVPELKIVSNVPVISMEEVAPVAMSDAAMLAPEEVRRKAKGDIIGKSERTDTDKNRERRKKKLKQRKHAQEKERKEKMVGKMRPGLGNPYSKEKAKKMLEKVTKEKNVDKMDESTGSKSVKSSTAFFTQLQEEVSSHIKGKTKTKNVKSKNVMSARKMKL